MVQYLILDSQALTEERCACVAYMRLLHNGGYFVEGCVS